MAELVEEDEDFLRRYAHIVASKLEEKVQELEKEISEHKRAEEELGKSEEKYRTLSTNIPGMIYRGKPDWSTEIVTQSENVCGYSLEEFNSGKVNWANIIMPDDKERVFKEASKISDSKMSMVQEYGIVAKDGSVHWVEDHKTSIFSKGGAFQGVDGVVFDISERKEAEKKIRHLASFPQHSPVMVIEFGRREEVLFSNPTMLSAIQQGDIGDPRQFIPANWRERLVHTESIDENIDIQEIQLAGRTFEEWLRFSREFQSLRIYATDITKRKRVEEALKKLNEELDEKVSQRTNELALANLELQELAKMRAEFISTASHDLRAPLTGVLGFAELLLRDKAGPLNEASKRYIQSIYQSGKDLLAIIEDFLELSRVDSGKLQINRQEINVADGISHSVAAMESLFAAKKIQLKVEFDENLPTLNADPNRFNQMLTNYLSNALKFTPEGGTVTIKAERPGDFIKVSVIDTGIGISLEEQKRLFERFFQAEATRYSIRGTGLGLSIVKQLTEAQGGTVGVKSELKKGSIFWFTLPVFKKEAK